MSGSEILGKLVKGGEILELGAEFGGSTEVLSDVCISKGGHLTTVDWWLGRDDVYDYFEFKFKNITTIIRKNLFDCEFKDSQFDTIYFDAIYSYPECVAMLRKYLPYLKKGGLAVGHGGDFWWSKVSPDIQKRLRYYIDRTKTAEICFPVNMEFAEAFATKETLV